MQEVPNRVTKNVGDTLYNKIISYALDEAGNAIPILGGVNGAAGTFNTPMTQAIAYKSGGNGDGQPEYVGNSAPGTAKGAALWSIQKITYDASHRAIDIQWADGTGAFTKEWDERATYTYS